MDFMKYKLFYFLLSLVVIVPGLVSLARFGLRSAIDFTGGSLWELRVGAHEEELKAALTTAGVVANSIQETEGSLLLRLPPLNEGEHQQLKATLHNQFQSIEEVRFESVGPTLGKELFIKTIVAVGLATLMILTLVAWRFHEFHFGVAAVIAMFHDTLILLGSFSLLGHFRGIEVDTLFVTAVLTILSFSVHDTIVVFDRIRETKRMYPRAELEAVINKSVAETVGRSINNSMTIIFMLLSLYLLGAPTLKNFILALLIGTITGTYSSTFTAAPLLLVLRKLRKRS